MSCSAVTFFLNFRDDDSNDAIGNPDNTDAGVADSS